MGNIAVIDSFKQELALQESNFRPLLPASIKPEKFQALVIAAVSGNPKLLECTRESLWKACIQGAELGLSLNPTLGEADILPVWNGMTKKNEAQFRPRYKGLMKLALQSKEVTSIRSVLVHEKDHFEVVEGLRPDIIHKPAMTGDRGPLTHVYCVWRLKADPEPQFEVMDRAQVMRIKARSPSGKDNKGPWATDEAEMWRKTVVRRASKYMPISCEAFQHAVAVDNIAEVGGEIEVTEAGDFIDITTAPEPEYTDAQVDAIEDSLPPEEGEAIETVEFLATDDWRTWVVRAYKVCKELPEYKRAEWIKHHEAMLEEAAQSQPTGVKTIRNFLVKE